MLDGKVSDKSLDGEYFGADFYAEISRRACS